MSQSFIGQTSPKAKSNKICAILHAHARGHSEGSGNGGEHGDDDVQDFTPKVLVFHDS